MSWRTTLVLLALVGVLGVLVWRQTEREDPEQYGQRAVPLLEDLDVRRVTKLRFDHLRRSQHIGLERDSGGRWFLVDPLAYPARTEMVEQLLRALRNQAWPVSDAELQELDPGLDPPAAVVELTERLESGAERKRQFEVGGVDLDNIRLFVRVEGKVLRTLRNLETPLEVFVEEWRSRQAFGLDPRTIVEVKREGFWYDEEDSTSLAFHAERRGNGWFVDVPARFHGHPLSMGGWALGLASLPVERFTSDLEGVDLGRWGLDNPWFRLTLTDRTSTTQTLLFASKDGGMYAKRTDLPYVWGIGPREVQTLRQDPRHLFDPHLAAVFRHDVDRIVVAGESARLRFTQDKASKRWTVAHRDGDGEWTLERPAGKDPVDRLLGTFEQVEIVDYLWDEPVADWFPPDAPLRGLWLEAGAERFGGRIGPEHRSAGGTETLSFLREGEDVVSLLPLAVGELLLLDPLSAESPLLLELTDQRLRFLDLSVAGGTPRKFQRTIQGTWVHRDTPALDAPQILPVLDRLLHLLVERHLPPAEHVPLEEVVDVRILSADGETLLAVGTTPSGEVRAQLGNRQSVLRSPELHGLLLEIAAEGE